MFIYSAIVCRKNKSHSGNDMFYFCVEFFQCQYLYHVAMNIAIANVVQLKIFWNASAEWPRYRGSHTTFL